MEKSIKVLSPATVANVSCGFDVLGFALDNPGDEISVKLTNTPGITIKNLDPAVNVPTNPEKNTAGVSLLAMIDELKTQQGFEITFHKKIKPSSGIGSSSASAAASVFAVNELLDKPFSRKDLVRFAMEGERAASGSSHADNVAPALLGGFVLVRSYSPLDIIEIPYPEDLYCTIVHPDIEIKTEDARRILKQTVPLKSAVQQWGNIAGLIAGLFKGNHQLIGRSLEDVIVEPVRSMLIPGYQDVKKAALDTGALGCSISGAGPSMFALSSSPEIAKNIGEIMGSSFNNIGINNDIYLSKINPIGAKVIG